MKIIKLNNKLILGTAQFGASYGFNNFKKKRLSKLEIFKILNFAYKNKITHIDTAESYNLKNFFLKNKNWVVDTKILIKKNRNSFLKIKKKLEFFTNQSNIELETVYIHNPELLFSMNGKKLYMILENLKEHSLIKKIGVSVYDPILLKRIIEKYKIDVAQFPYNIFDRRFDKIMKFLKKKNVNIYVRSVFLQGALLSKRKTQMTLLPEFKKLNKFSQKMNIDKMSLCLNFVNNNNLIDKIIFGVDSLNQIKSILSCKKIKKINFDIFKTKKTKIIDPRNWEN